MSSQAQTSPRLALEANAAGSDTSELNLGRRRWLQAMVAGSGLALLPVPTRLWAQSPAGLSRFMAVSGVLTERGDLDVAVGEQLYQALAAEQAEAQPAVPFDKQIATLAAHLAAIPAALDDSDQAVATRVMQAWYLGVVGDAETGRVVSYEQALMFTALRGALPPRTYCATRPGAWARPPLLAEVVS